jgi:hypothetical protein
MEKHHYVYIFYSFLIILLIIIVLYITFNTINQNVNNDSQLKRESYKRCYNSFNGCAPLTINTFKVGRGMMRNNNNRAVSGACGANGVCVNGEFIGCNNKYNCRRKGVNKRLGLTRGGCQGGRGCGIIRNSSRLCPGRTLNNYIPGSPFATPPTQYTTYDQKLPTGAAYLRLGKQ